MKKIVLVLLTTLLSTWVAGQTPRVNSTSTGPTGHSNVFSGFPATPMTGIYTIDPSGSGTNNFTSFTAAIQALNASGTGTGGVTFNVAANAVFTENPPAITATGTLSDQVVFQKSGSGANPVIRPTGTAATQEGAIKLTGCDYITFNGINITINTGYAQEYGFYLVGVDGANGCQNNTIKNSVITLNATNTSSYGIYCYSYGTSATGTNSYNKFYNNIITNCYGGIALTGTSNTYDTGNEIGTEAGGISEIQLPGTTANVTCNGVVYTYETGLKVFNTKISMNAIGTWGSAYGIYSYIGSGNTVNIYNNEITGFQATFGGYFAAGIYITSGTSCNIYSNTIHGISNSFTGISAAGSSAYGIYISTGTSINVYSNKVYDVLYAGPSAHSANGIYISNGTTISVYNNMVYDVRAPLSTSASAGACGIYLGGGTTVSAFYNSVLMNYNAAGSGTNRSAAIYVTSTPANVDLRNNVFVNLTNLSGNSSGSSRAISFLRNATSLSNLSASCNNNLYYSGTPGSKNLIHYDGTNSDQTLAAYKARVAPRDQNAVTENPPFLSTSGTYDLHMNTTVPTQCESNGIRITSPFAITSDLDNDIRWGETGYSGGGTAPDLGADEFTGVSADYDPPVITYSPLGNTSSLTARTLVATITDVKSGVGSGANKPVLYWKINGAAYTGPVPPQSINGHQYTFVFGSGVTITNVVSYFIVAQDNATIPNVASSPAGAVCTYNPPLASSPPPVPATYTIIGSICGTKTVGAGGDYPTLTAAAADINSKELCGPLTLQLTDGTYGAGETFPVTINSNPGSGPVNQILIKPAAGITPVITCNTASAVFSLSGSDYIVFDGSGQAGGTSKDLTIVNDYTAGIYNYGIALNHNGTRGATNTTIKNCILKGNPLYSNCFAVYMNTAGGGYHNTTILNITVKKVNTGIFCSGANGNVSNNILISGNTIGDLTEPVKQGGISVTYCDNTIISGNDISGELNGNTNYNQFGVYLGAGATNSKIRQNRIHDFYYSGTGGWGCSGISFAGEATSATEISNNLIYDIKADGYSSGVIYCPAGIVISSGGNLHVWFNSIYLSGPVLSGNFNSFSSGISVNTGVTQLDIRNNIIQNSQTASGGSATHKTYAVYSLSANTAFSEINFNDYFPDGINGNVGYLGSDQTSLASWQSATNKDAASLSTNPQFVSATDLTPTNIALNGAGTPATTVNVDFYNVTRLNPPDIGAIEFGVQVPPGLEVGNITVSEGQTICYNASQTITVAGNGSTFNVNSGGNVHFIAGQNILFLPGTSVATGGNMHGYITTTGNYCENQSDSPVYTGSRANIKSTGGRNDSFFKVYPNPTSNRFTVEMTEENRVAPPVIMCFGPTGETVFNDATVNGISKEFSLQGKTPGIYFIMVIDGNKTGTARIIKY